MPGHNSRTCKGLPTNIAKNVIKEKEAVTKKATTKKASAEKSKRTVELMEEAVLWILLLLHHHLSPIHRLPCLLC
ncbi:hypothetical protein IFM89_002998 [Coptis chinensis]|uniref:Uncharacterized protein n=1 Tax=Coptis chinensis TaxID=261450 RepID=A0A835IU28_9MAGN|nr:hypothetical protein IFM89_002998 [Coptis chinensis]